MSAIRIQPTADDIREGIAGDCARCPYALAICRALGEPVRVSALVIPALGVNRPPAIVFGRPRHCRIALPPVVGDWILRYDTFKKLPPAPAILLDIEAGTCELAA